jgi:predicted RNA-binding Zn-ribbon protein involved in translation (DUF1610 family)
MITKNTIIECGHKPEYKMTFSCSKAGDYVLKICKKCRTQETDEFLIREESID